MDESRIVFLQSVTQRIALVSAKIRSGGKGITLPLGHPIMRPAYGFYLLAFGFGGKGIRTPGLLIANETLYQLSYTPARSTIDRRPKLSKQTRHRQANLSI